MFAPWKKSYDKPRQCIKNQRHNFADKHLSSQSYDFSHSHVWLWELDHKEVWAPKNWCFRTMELETLGSLLDSKEMKPVNPKGNQPWIFIGRTDQFSSVQFSHSAVSDSLWPHGLQHTRPPCPSPTPRVYSNSCPLNWWCHPTISSSVIPFSSCLQSFSA